MLTNVEWNSSGVALRVRTKFSTHLYNKHHHKHLFVVSGNITYALCVCAALWRQWCYNTRCLSTVVVVAVAAAAAAVGNNILGNPCAHNLSSRCVRWRMDPYWCWRKELCLDVCTKAGVAEMR